MEYTCPRCGTELGEPYCTDCGIEILEPASPEKAEPASPKQAEPVGTSRPTSLAPSTAAEDRLSRALDAVKVAESKTGDRRGSEPKKAADNRSTASNRAASSSPSNRSASSSSGSRTGKGYSTTKISNIASEHRALKEYIDQGYEVYLATGIAGCGKTQMLDAFEEQYSSLRVGGGWSPLRSKMKGARALPTAPGVVNCHPISLGRRKVVFVDTSGEDFRYLYPDMWRTGQIDRKVLNFLRLVVQNLRGLILLIDLQRLWAPKVREPGDTEQIEIQTWILQLLRWLRSGDDYPSNSPLPFAEYVNARVRAGRARRLSCPVQIFYSKSDEIVGLEVPSGSVPWSSRRHQNREVYPAGEKPFWFTFHSLRPLYSALIAHARHFRFDFAHSMVLDPTTGVVHDQVPTGVLLSVEWLLDPSWRRWPSWTILPTRFWVAAQRTLDRLTGNRQRWRHLPPPEDL